MKKQHKLEVIKVTPELAVQLLERNKNNRPINQVHVHRIARQISEGKWKFNGDTIKIDLNDNVLDGQHRLWAIVESNTPVETVVVYGIEREAWATIDTLKSARTGKDILAMNGVARYRPTCSMALTWMLRYQRGILMDYLNPKNRIEVSDIEGAYASHPGILHAAERAHRLKGIINPSLGAFLYYLFNNHNPEIADRFMQTMEDPSGVSINDPFFKLRVFLTAAHRKGLNPLMVMALAIKAANAIYENKKLSILVWKYQARSPENFPELRIGRPKAKLVLTA